MDDKHHDRGAGPAPSRRTFLRMAGGWMLAGLGLTLAPAAPAAARASDRTGGLLPLAPSSPANPRRPTLLDQMDRATFTGLTGTVFSFAATGRAVALKLLDVQDRRRPSALAASSGECFALRFQGPPDASLEQGTYRVEHRRLGTFDLFIVPVGADAGRLYFEAVFNRVTG